MKTEDTTKFDKLSWLLGIWKGKQGDASIYESWTKQNYRIIDGVSFTTQDKVRIYSQTMKLEQSNNKIFMIINPKETNKTTTLNLKSVTDSSAVFVNEDSTSYPKKIVYFRKPRKRMEVKIDGKTSETSTTLEYKKTNNY